ncbi:MAG: iron-containing alcohol dehydrogenase, partial [Chloroflexi bacterium]|nr:iron-containing alcohol dehydrogenase [Chloroflexota bacterium]
MTLSFEFATAARILFGTGTVNQVAELARGLGRKALVVHGARAARAQALQAALEEAGIACGMFSVPGEPTIQMADEGAYAARQAGCDLVIGIGGGSVLDGAKAVAALATNPGPALDYMEVIGRGLPVRVLPLPFIAIPTTAGTGTEVTRNTVLLSPEHRVKVSIRHPLLLPRVAVVDPELTYSAPPAVTAAAGMDALTQLIEPFLSIRANPLTDGLAREGMRRVARSLERAYTSGSDPEAREDMALASLFGGLSLANSGLGVVHGISGPLGGMFAAPHGAACAQILPRALRINVRAMRARAPRAPGLVRAQVVAALLTGAAAATPEDGVEWLEQVCRRLQIAPLSQYGVTSEDIPALI